jgi:hypothetical protein
MKLFRLLEQHDHWCPEGSFSEILGDGFLLEHNRLYRTIRKATLERGFILTSEFNPAYLALPLAQLESLIEKKRFHFSTMSQFSERLRARSLRQVFGMKCWII